MDGCYSYWLGGAHTIVRTWFEYMNDHDRNRTSSSSSSSPTKLSWDPWMKQYEKKRMEQEQEIIVKNNNSNQSSSDEDNNVDADTAGTATDSVPYVLFDYGMLQRYILLCAQDVHGGLRDKPSKSRDFYHTCYNLSGLSISQHYSEPPKQQERRDNKKNNGHEKFPSNDDHGGCNIRFGHPQFSCVGQTHPCYNLRMDRVRYARTKFGC